MSVNAYLFRQEGGVHLEPKTFGYARVSSKGQNLDRQIFLLKEEGIDERDIFVEKESAKDFERPVFLQQEIGRAHV